MSEQKTIEQRVAVNNVYTLTVGAPLLRPGLTLSTQVSEKYVASASSTLLVLVRAINQGPGDME